MMAFAPAYILLSISYEVLFYVALCLALSSWVRMEHLSSMTKSQSRQKTNAAVSIRDFRTAFLFLLFIKIAFFGTGNVASMSSFEISSTYRFVTVFAPFLMGFLLVIKILIPFTLVGAAFHVIVGLKDRNPYHFFLLVVGLSDYLSIHFLFLVENEGSWKQIGNSISMFGIVNAQIIFIPLVFVLSRVFVQDLFTLTRNHHNKAS
jgi:phosphatidylinositol glycan class N